MISNRSLSVHRQFEGIWWKPRLRRFHHCIQQNLDCRSLCRWVNILILLRIRIHIFLGAYGPLQVEIGPGYPPRPFWEPMNLCGRNLTRLVCYSVLAILMAIVKKILNNNTMLGTDFSSLCIFLNKYWKFKQPLLVFPTFCLFL